MLRQHSMPFVRYVWSVVLFALKSGLWMTKHSKTTCFWDVALEEDGVDMLDWKRLNEQILERVDEKAD